MHIYKVFLAVTSGREGDVLVVSGEQRPEMLLTFL